LMAKLDFVMEFLSSLMEVVSATTHTQLLSWLGFDLPLPRFDFHDRHTSCQGHLVYLHKIVLKPTDA
jgi:hypothetical protein